MWTNRFSPFCFEQTFQSLSGETGYRLGTGLGPGRDHSKIKLKKGKWVSVLIENKCLTSYIYFANSWFSKDFKFCIFILTSTITSGQLVCFVLFFPPAIIDLVTFTQGLTLVRYWNSKNALVTFSLSGLLRNTEDLHKILFYNDFLPPENQHQ